MDTLFDLHPDPAPAHVATIGPHRLRPYQEAAIAGIREQFTQHQSTILVMPTGTGKTVVFAHLAKLFTGRVMILAHRGELIAQAMRSVGAITGESVSVEMAEQWVQGKPRIVVSSIQTQVAGRNGDGRMTRFNADEFDLVIVDEAHRSCAQTYRRVLNHYTTNPRLKLLGVTATPDRHDEEALGQVYQSVAYDYELPNAISDGWLVPICQSAVAVDGLDYSEIKTTAGDLNTGQLAAVMEEESVLHRVAHPVYEIAAGRKTLVFASSVAHAERMCEIFNRHESGCANWVCGKTPKDDRRRMFKDYARGQFQFLVNVDVATEGFDEPGIRVVAVARPTKSRPRFAQMIGRGTRPLAGTVDGLPDAATRRDAIAGSDKPNLEVIDFVGNAGKHQLVSTADILGGNESDEVVARARKKIEADDGKPADVAEVLEKAREEIEEEKRRERIRREKLVGLASYSKKAINPFDVFDMMPSRERGWDRGRRLTDKQVKWLEGQKIDWKNLSYAQNKQVLNKMAERKQQGLCSLRQVTQLRRHGYTLEEAEAMTSRQAGAVMGRIASTNWKYNPMKPRRKTG